MTTINTSVIDSTPEGHYKIGEFISNSHPVSIKITSHGIVIAPKGLVTATGDDEVIFLEHYEGKWRLLVWADKTQEDPTHVIQLTDCAE